MPIPSETQPLIANGRNTRNGAVEPAVERPPPGTNPIVRPDMLKRPSMRYFPFAKTQDDRPHAEHHTSNGDLIRDITIGFADGLTVPFALTAGLSTLGSTKLVVIGGLAELFSGSKSPGNPSPPPPLVLSSPSQASSPNSDLVTVISMGLGAYLAAATERQHYEAEYERECWEVDHCPEREREEIFEVLEKYGISRDGAKGVVDELCVATPKGKERWVQFMMDFELQLQEPDTTAAWKSAATMGLSYFVGGLIPMVPYFVMDVAQQALLASIAITVVILLVFGYVKSWYVFGCALGGGDIAIPSHHPLLRLLMPQLQPGSPFAPRRPASLVRCRLS